MNAIRTTRSRQSRLPRIAGIAMFVVAALIMPGGCSDDPQSSARSAEKTPADKSVTASTDGTMLDAADPFDLQAPAVRRDLAVERVVKEAGVALAGSDKLKDVIAKVQVELIEFDEAPVRLQMHLGRCAVSRRLFLERRLLMSRRPLLMPKVSIYLTI